MHKKKGDGYVELIPKQTFSKGYFDLHIPENIINRVFKTKGSSIKRLAGSIPIFNQHLQSMLAGPKQTVVGKRSKWLIKSSADVDKSFDSLWNNIKGPFMTSNRTSCIHIGLAIVMHDLELLEKKVCPDNIFLYADLIKERIPKEQFMNIAGDINED